ncbi:oligopeptide-binding protein AliB [Clostridia bacterium]|nr:oligopeptide-binding protein AliB [Clostridia bacterium]
MIHRRINRPLALLLCALFMAASLSAFAPALAEDAAYRTIYGAEVTTLNYLTTSTENVYSLASNLFDTLVEYDRYGNVQPSAATSWEVSEDDLTWTFHLREGMKWVDGSGNPVAEVTAADFEAAAKYILDAQNASSMANVLYDIIVGAEDYFNGTSTPEEGADPAPVTEWSTVGIKALDALTLQYSLNAPVPYFLSMTTYCPFMPVYEPFLLEKGETFALATGNNTLLYNGAYYLAEFKPQESRLLKKNPHNWDADNVFIDLRSYTYNAEAATVDPELFLRGEVDEAEFNSEVAAEWLSDPAKADLIRPIRRSGFYTYFYSFNYEPKFAAEYEPENWKLAVNNENFRKAFYYAFDRIGSQAVFEPSNPESIIFNTITPPEFAALNGVDYTMIGDLAPITALGTGTYDEETALKYRDLAKEELTAAGVTFPVKVLLTYNASSNSWADESVVEEQHLESLLGTDFIEVIVEARPSSGFLANVRRSGDYGLMKCNWGPDYADPQTFVDPFGEGNSYNFMDKGLTQADEGGSIVAQYYALVDAARAETSDIEKRYELFAKAEAYFIDHAIVVPLGYGSGGYIGSWIDPYEGQFAPFGVSNYRYKGQHLLDKPMSTDEYFDSYDAWTDARAALTD